MYIGTLLTVVSVLVLYGLLHSTEKILTLRRQPVRIKERKIEPRSRL